MMELLQRQKQKRTKTREPFLHAQCTDNTSSITVHIKALPDAHFENVGCQSVCLRADAPISDEGLRLFHFLTFLFHRPPSACLKLKDSSALSVYVMETDESQGRAEQDLHFSSLAEA